MWKAVRWEEACEGVGFFMESGVKSGVIGTWDKGLGEAEGEGERGAWYEAGLPPTACA